MLLDKGTEVYYLAKFTYLTDDRDAVFSLPPCFWFVPLVVMLTWLFNKEGVYQFFFHYKAIYFPFAINKHFVRIYFEITCISLLIKLYQLLSTDVSWLDSLLLWWLPNGCFLILSFLLQRWVGILLKGKVFIFLYFYYYLLWCSNFPRWASGKCFKLVSVFFWHASIILFF